MWTQVKRHESATTRLQATPLKAANTPVAPTTASTARSRHGVPGGSSRRTKATSQGAGREESSVPPRPFGSGEQTGPPAKRAAHRPRVQFGRCPACNPAAACNVSVQRRVRFQLAMQGNQTTGPLKAGPTEAVASSRPSASWDRGFTRGPTPFCQPCADLAVPTLRHAMAARAWTRVPGDAGSSHGRTVPNYSPLSRARCWTCARRLVPNSLRARTIPDVAASRCC